MRKLMLSLISLTLAVVMVPAVGVASVSADRFLYRGDVNLNAAVNIRERSVSIICCILAATELSK